VCAATYVSDAMVCVWGWLFRGFGRGWQRQGESTEWWKLRWSVWYMCVNTLWFNSHCLRPYASAGLQGTRTGSWILESVTGVHACFAEQKKSRPLTSGRAQKYARDYGVLLCTRFPSATPWLNMHRPGRHKRRSWPSIWFSGGQPWSGCRVTGCWVA